MKNLIPPRRLEFEALEPRVLFSASLAPAPAPEPAPEAGEPVQERQDAPPEAADENQAAPPPPENTEGAEAGTETGAETAPETADGAAGGDVVFELSQVQVEQIGAAAAERWIAAGVDADQLQRLSEITYSVEQFQGSILGAAEGNHIFVDIDGAGAGWFVDSTPLLDEEFAAGENGNRLLGQSGGAQSATDLLTVLLHEQGHILGLPDYFSEPENIMNENISAGERVLPLPGQADGSTPAPNGNVEFANATSNVVLDPPSFPTPVEVGDTVNIDGTFQNATGNAITVELLDENNNVVDSVIVAPANNAYSFTVDADEAGVLEFTISAFDPTNQLVDFDTTTIEIEVNDTQQPPATESPANETPALPIIPIPPVVTAPVDPIPDPANLAEPPVEIEVGIVTPDAPLSFLDRFGGTGILSEHLYGDESLFAFDPSQFSAALPSIAVTVFDKENNIIGFQDFVFFGDFSLAGANSILDQLAINFESMGLARIEIIHGAGSAFLDYVAGDFLEASRMTTGPNLFGE